MSNETEEWPEFVKIALKEEPYLVNIIFSAALLTVFVTSLMANILTCTVIYCDKTMHTATNYYLFNLAVSDLFVTFPILIIVYQLLVQQNEIIEFKYGFMVCKLFLCINFIFTSLLWHNGILVMTVLSIERYIAICYPMMLKGTSVWRRVVKIIVAIWIIAIVHTLMLLWTLNILDTKKSLLCFWFPTPTTRIITGVLGTTSFILPLGIMIFVHTKIAFKVNKKVKYNIKDCMVHNKGFKRRNVNKLIALTVSFVICWLPFFILRVVMFFADMQVLMHMQKWYAIAHKLAMLNSWFTTVLNPLLFNLMSTKFRKALKVLWNRKVKAICSKKKMNP